MIPKIIHYCWFGHTPLPKSVRRCIDSWQRYFPDYEIREWNECNFNVYGISYTAEAYRHEKYAFVSDYARFYILYTVGGIYFDTDVEVIRPMDDILAKGAFMGIERSSDHIGVNTGLGMAAEAGMEVYEELLAHYSTLAFANRDGQQLPGTVVKHTTDVLRHYGFILQDRLQQIAGITIYPNEYFNPLNDATGKLTVSAHTRSIHWYAKTWVDHYGPVRIWLTRRLHRMFGVYCLSWLKRYIPI